LRGDATLNYGLSNNSSEEE